MDTWHNMILNMIMHNDLALSDVQMSLSSRVQSGVHDPCTPRRAIRAPIDVVVLHA